MPYIIDPPEGPPRGIILPSDDNVDIPQKERGRPIEPAFWDINLKLDFMKQHNITTSVISLANPWLDFLPPEQAVDWAAKINDDLDKTCKEYGNKEGKIPAKGSFSSSSSALFAFGVLPLSAPRPEDVANEARRLKTLPYVRGAILSSQGLGKGLDDPALDPMWSAFEETQLVLFLHPHYGIPIEAYGGADKMTQYGHILPLAIGFTVETTIAITRMYLSGVFERFPNLKILLAHSGGTLPFLAGRIENSILHERAGSTKSAGRPRRDIWDVLHKNIYLDAVIYADPGLKAAIEAAGSTDRLLYGKLIHPLFIF